MRQITLIRGALAALAVAFMSVAHAQDMLKIAAGQRGNWDTSISELGMRSGIFKKHGIAVEILWTQGAGETQQAVIAGSADLGIAGGIMGALSAFSKGAPVRIISAETTGASDLYWYVPTASPIKTLKDTDGKTIAYSTNGSSTHGIVTAYMKQFDLKAKPTATGSPSATLTQVMSGQIDVGWAAPPFGLKQLDEGAIRDQSDDAIRLRQHQRHRRRQQRIAGDQREGRARRIDLRRQHPVAAGLFRLRRSGQSRSLGRCPRHARSAAHRLQGRLGCGRTHRRSGHEECGDEITNNQLRTTKRITGDFCYSLFVI